MRKYLLLALLFAIPAALAQDNEEECGAEHEDIDVHWQDNITGRHNTDWYVELLRTTLSCDRDDTDCSETGLTDGLTIAFVEVVTTSCNVIAIDKQFTFKYLTAIDPDTGEEYTVNYFDYCHHCRQESRRDDVPFWKCNGTEDW
jgi:hypothetical protein